MKWDLALLIELVLSITMFFSLGYLLGLLW